MKYYLLCSFLTNSENVLELFKTLESYMIFMICHLQPVDNSTHRVHLYHYTRTCNNELGGSFKKSCRILRNSIYLKHFQNLFFTFLWASWNRWTPTTCLELDWTGFACFGLWSIFCPAIPECHCHDAV